MIDKQCERWNQIAEKVWAHDWEEIGRHACDHRLSTSQGKMGEGRTKFISNFTKYTLHDDAM